LHLDDFLISTKLTPNGIIPTDHGNYSVVGHEMSLRRQYEMYIIKSFMPTFALVLMASISFKIPGVAIPGRMALLITIFLVLVNIANSSESHFSSNGLNALDIWLRLCMAFVACAIGEYAIILSIIYKGCAKVRANNDKNGSIDNLEHFGTAAALDKKAFFAFLACFCFCNAIYWPCYLL